MDLSYEQEELLPLEHKSLDTNRLKHPTADLERAFAEEWEKVNLQESSVNFGMGTLQNLMVRQNDGYKIDYWITQREATIVATVIQWLGTNCGYGFLLSVFDKCNLTVCSSNRKLYTCEKHTPKKKRLLLIKE